MHNALENPPPLLSVRHPGLISYSYPVTSLRVVDDADFGDGETIGFGSSGRRSAIIQNVTLDLYYDALYASKSAWIARSFRRPKIEVKYCTIWLAIACVCADNYKLLIVTAKLCYGSLLGVCLAPQVYDYRSPVTRHCANNRSLCGQLVFNFSGWQHLSLPLTFEMTIVRKIDLIECTRLGVVINMGWVVGIVFVDDDGLAVRSGRSFGDNYSDFRCLLIWK
ncbi:hypothetical protein TNIN_316461 [Trichonephila inaurata madagascariensis]|uniref:Uncharacterized protein n=1 Tax=Trichonephila inaurata madagascariensis TaxID=2747483 RepID=A0A8X6IWX9_9ARAC|nr:hypothetical protein TNIN_316461 [Trichonephila inaurata madagascariensis]